MAEGRLEDRIVSVVVGVASGIGEALVKQLAERGDNVIAVDRRDGFGLDGTLMFHDYPDVRYFQGDFTSATHLHLLQDYIQKTGLCYVTHLAITAGGVYEKGEGNSIEEIPDEAFLGSVTTNLVGPFLTIKSMFSLMKKAPEWQHKSITLPGSSNMEGGYGLIPYSAAKAGLAGLAGAAMNELGHHGITINVVEIGGTKTPALPESLYHSIEERSPLKRMNDPEDVAGVYQFLASPAARNITGAVIPANFGQTITRR